MITRLIRNDLENNNPAAMLYNTKYYDCRGLSKWYGKKDRLSTTCPDGQDPLKRL